MKDDLFDSEAKIKSGISNFTNLLSHPGWKLIEEILNANIEIIKEQLEVGVEDETKTDIDLLRKKLSIYREVLNTPKNMIIKLQSPEGVEPSIDPFDTAEDIKKRREAGQTDTT